MNIAVALCELKHNGDRMLADWLPPVTKRGGIQLLIPSTEQIDIADRVTRDPANAEISLWGPFVMHHHGQEPALLLERTRLRLTADTSLGFDGQEWIARQNQTPLVGHALMVPFAIKLPDGVGSDSRAMSPSAWLSGTDGNELPRDVADRFGIKDLAHQQEFLVGSIIVNPQ